MQSFKLTDLNALDLDRDDFEDSTKPVTRISEALYDIGGIITQRELTNKMEETKFLFK